MCPQINNALSSTSPEQAWSGPFKQPTRGVVTTEYGLRRYYNGTWAANYYHRGIDYGAPEGEPVISPAGGRVSLVGSEDGGYHVHGNCVCVDHGQGVVSLMMHLKSVAVKQGDFVETGDMLGEVGETGLATGPHLHWGLWVQNKSIDPASWMASGKESARRPIWAC